MVTKKNGLVYKRDKSKIEISGESDQVKWPMWFDLVSHKLMWMVLVIVLLCVIPKVSWLPVVWQWAKRQIPLLSLLGVTADFILLLSG